MQNKISVNKENTIREYRNLENTRDHKIQKVAYIIQEVRENKI
jgi:hypothetical protein